MALEPVKKRQRLVTDKQKVSPNDPLPSGADVINKLPNEILLRILGYLDSYDIVRNISGVSQRFETLSKDPTLLRALVFSKEDCLDESMIDALKHSKNLKELSFEGCGEPNVTNLLKIAMKHCTKLTSIDINDKRINDTQLIYIFEYRHRPLFIYFQFIK